MKDSALFSDKCGVLQIKLFFSVTLPALSGSSHPSPAATQQTSLPSFSPVNTNRINISFSETSCKKLLYFSHVLNINVSGVRGIWGGP